MNNMQFYLREFYNSFMFTLIFVVRLFIVIIMAGLLLFACKSVYASLGIILCVITGIVGISLIGAFISVSSYINDKF